jgi:hypothetical protein
MDSVTRYKEIIKETLQEFLERYQPQPERSNIDTLLTADDERGVYLILRTGWQAKERVQRILIYIRLINNRVYVEEDWTDFDVVGRLLDAGIPQEDVVLAFHHPSLRPFTEFALA